MSTSKQNNTACQRNGEEGREEVTGQGERNEEGNVIKVDERKVRRKEDEGRADMVR